MTEYSSSDADAEHAFASAGPALSSVTEAAQKLIATANEHGLGKNDLIRIIKELT